MRLSSLKSTLFVMVVAAGIGAVAYAQGQASRASAQGAQGQQGQGQQGQGQQGQGQQGQGQQGQGAQGQGRQGGGAPLQNIQVLPKDTTRQQITGIMRGFTAALGVMCDHCHVGTMQERSKDDNPKKAIARKMIQMTAAINGEHLKGVGDPAPDGAAKVTCYSCHRGALKPLTAAPSGGGGH